MARMLSDFLSPSVIFFGIVAIGLPLGAIKIRGISVGASAVLLLAIAFGFLSAKIPPMNLSETEITHFKVFSQLGTALFLSAIGMQNGNGQKKLFTVQGIQCILIGAFTSFIGFAGAKVIGKLDQALESATLRGIFCGAMTSSPGLTSACEISEAESYLSVIGYGWTYPFGVLATVLFVQFVTRKNDVKVMPKKSDVTCPSPSKQFPVFTLIGIAILIGSALGCLKIPYLEITLGNSGGILCAAYLIGFATRCIHIKVDSSALTHFRSLGLLLFFVGNGVPAGGKLLTNFNWKWVLYGMLITLLPLLLHFFILRVLIQKNSITTAFLVAGAMTSTPAVGVLLEKHESDHALTLYSCTYLGALLPMTILPLFI